MKPVRSSTMWTLASVALLPAAAAMAGLSVEFELADALVTIDPAGGIPRVLAVPLPGSASSLEMTLVDEDLPTPEVDSVSIPNTQIPLFLLDMRVFDPSSPGGDWTAAGSLAFADLTGAPKVWATCDGTSVTLDGSDLVISGPLATEDPGPSDAILVGTGSSWVFAGLGSQGGADGNPGTITVPTGRAGYDFGDLTLTIHGVSGTLESFFHPTCPTSHAGKVAGAIVPLPGAAGLGVLGIALAGWSKRRRALG